MGDRVPDLGSSLLNYLLYSNLTSAILLPLFIGWAVARFTGSAGLAIAVGFPVGYALTAELPPLPTLASDQKVAYLVLAGAALGLLLALFRAGEGWRRVCLVLWPAAGLAWIAWRPLAAATPALLLTLAALWLAAAVVMWRLDAEAARDADWDRIGYVPTMMAAGAVGVAAVALFAGSTSLLFVCVSLAMAVWGANMANWRRPRAAFGTTALLASGGGVFFLAAIAALYADASVVALALLVPVFWVDRLSSSARGIWFRRGATAGIATVPVLLAVAAAYAVLFIPWAAPSG